MAKAYNIVVVDDTDLIRNINANFCKSLENELGPMDVVDFDDGVPAWNYLQTTKPDLLITDMNMKKMHGHELVKKAREKYNDLPVILISSNHGLHLDAELLKTDFLPKPYNPDELHALVRKYSPKVRK